MFQNVIKHENVIKNNLLYRASLRGLKKCTSCGFINGQRALICRNVNCDLRIQRLAAIKPFDPIQLITFGHTKLYSLRTKEKLLQPRNFVRITQFMGPMDSHPRFVCYVENCKYDALEPAHLVCRHIKSCKEITHVPQAEVYAIDKSILWNLNIPIEQKHHLWNLYQLEEKVVPPVQKLNSSIFVVKCVESKLFPVGRLHVTVFSNKFLKKSGSFSCSCKKLKIIVEPDNSVIMKPEICDHLLLLLAAILNKPEGKTLYSKFLDMLQYLWMPTCLNTPIVDSDTRPAQFTDYDLSLDGYNKPDDKIEHFEASDNSDIFNFTEELFAANNIPDFSDIILEVNTDKDSEIQKTSKADQRAHLESFKKDPKLNSTITNKNDEDMEFNFLRLNPVEAQISLPAVVKETPTNFNENALSVMEQFQLHHNVQVLNESIELANDIESLNNLESPVVETNVIAMPCTPKQKSLLRTSGHINNTKELLTKTSKIINPEQGLTTLPIPKSTVLKQVPLKIIKIATPTKKLSTNPAEINPKNMIVIKSNQIVDSVKQIANNRNALQLTAQLANRMENKQTNSILMPSISYESWLDHIIEILNENVTIQDSPFIKSSFHVPDVIFNHFSKTFTLNNTGKRSNNVTVDKSEKDHIIYTWYFDEASTVNRIFASKNMKIEMERVYQRLADGSYEMYTPTTAKLTDNKHLTRIYPEIQLYKAFIQFTNSSELSTNGLQPHECGLKLEWLPSALPKSNFGLMTIEFCVSVEISDGTV